MMKLLVSRKKQRSSIIISSLGEQEENRASEREREGNVSFSRNIGVGRVNRREANGDSDAHFLSCCLLEDAYLCDLKMQRAE